MWNLDVSLAEGTVMACSALLSPFPCHSKVALPTELSVPCLFPAFLSYRENWLSEPCPLCQLAKSLEGRCSVSDITFRSSPSFLRRTPPCRLLVREPACLSLADRLPWPSHFILTLEETVQSPAICRQDPRLLSSLPACLSFPLFLRIWPTKAFTNDSYSEARANKRLEKKNPVNVWFAFSVNLLSCQGHFDWLLASLVNSQITQAASISFSQIDKSVSSITPTLIIQF